MKFPLVSRLHFLVVCISFVPTTSADEPKKLPEHAVIRLGSGDFTHGNYITKLALLPESSHIVTIDIDLHAKVWDKNGRLVRSVPRGVDTTGVFFSMDGRWRMETRSINGLVGAKPFRVLTHLADEVEFTSIPVHDQVESMSISGDGKLLVVCNRGCKVSLIDTHGDVVLARTVLPGPTILGYPRLFLTPDATILFAEQPNGIWHLFDVKDRNFEKPLPSPDGFGNAKPVMSSRCGIGAMIGWNGRILIRDFLEGQNLVEFKHGAVTALDGSFSPDDKAFATCGADGFIRLWDVETGRQIREIYTEEPHLRAVKYQADGKTLVSGGGQCRVRFWNVETGQEITSATAERGALLSAAISPDGRFAALAGTLGEISLWDLKTGEPMRDLPDRIFTGQSDPWVSGKFLAFSPDGKLLVAGSLNHHNTVDVWNVLTRARATVCTGHKQPIICTAISPEGDFLVSGSRDDTVRVWSLTGKQRWQVTANTTQVLSLALSADCQRVYSAGHTDMIRVWIHRTEPNWMTSSWMASIRSSRSATCRSHIPKNTWRRCSTGIEMDPKLLS